MKELNMENGYDVLKNFDAVRDNLFVKLSAKGKYDNCPTWTYAEDMEMTVHIFIGDCISAVLNNDLMRYYRLHGVSEDNVFFFAKQNTAREFGFVTIPLSNFGSTEIDCGAVVVTNNYVFGAVSLLLGDHLDKMYSELNGSYFVLPSSVHEFICVPDDGEGDVDYLKSMVTEINKEMVDGADKLTDSVYRYNGVFFEKVA